MHHIALIPWLDPELIISSAGPWALLVVCFIVFAETGLLVGFLLPGDTLLVISGLLTHTSDIFGLNIWWVALLIAVAAFIGGEVGYWIGHKGGPAVFERKESGIFSVKNVQRTNVFFTKYGALAVILARFVPIVRTFAPVAAGIGHMDYRKYSLYNAAGALLWGFGLTMLGYVIAFVPWISDLVTRYIDLILLAAVFGSVILTLIHYLMERAKARKADAAGEDVTTDASEADALVLDQDALDGQQDAFDAQQNARDAHPDPRSDQTLPGEQR